MSRFTGLVICAGCIAGLALLTRYAFLPLLLVGMWALRRKPLHAALFVGLGTIPLGLWFIRNWVLTHTLMGVRFPSVQTPLEVLEDYTSVVLIWVIQIGVIYAGYAFVVYSVQWLYDRFQHQHRIQPPEYIRGKITHTAYTQPDSDVDEGDE